MIRRTCTVAGLLATALVLVILFVHSGWISTFAVVAEAGGDERAKPLAVAISRLLLGGLVVVVLGLFGWRCLRALRR
jgi:amino acid transporter